MRHLTIIFTLLLCACSPALAQTKPATAPTTGTIHGTVTSGPAGETLYLDANGNGKLDTGEATTTVSGGVFSFSNVTAGAYTIRQQLPVGYVQATPAASSGVAVTVVAGKDTANVSFTDVATTISGMIAGGCSGETLYLDANNNSKLDPGEFSVKANGLVYSFVAIPPGQYIVRQQLRPGFTETVPTHGYGIHLTVKAGDTWAGQNFTDTSSTFVTGLGDSSGAGATYAVGMAPATDWVDARNLGNIRYVGGVPGYGDSFQWDFGCPGQAGSTITDPRTHAVVDASNGQHGFLAAFTYNTPGSYPVKLTITKPGAAPVTYTSTAVVTADGRKPYYFASTGNDSNTGTDAQHPWTGARFASVAKLPGVHLTALDTVPVTMTGTISIASNTVIEGPFNVNLVGGGFSTYGETGVLLRGLTAAAPGTPKLAGTYPWIDSGPTFFNGRGTGVAIENCTIGVVNRIVFNVDNSVDGMLLENIRQTVPNGIGSQCFAQFAGSKLINLGNYLTGSSSEITDRLESNGTGAVYEYNFFGQDIADSRSLAKGAFCCRHMIDVWFCHNVVSDADLSITSGGASGQTPYTTHNSRWTDNFITSPKAPAKFSIEAGSIGLTADNNTSDIPTGAAIQVAPKADGSWPISDIVIGPNTFTGPGARLDVLYSSVKGVSTVSPVGAVRPLVAASVAGVPAVQPVKILSGLVTATGFTSGGGSVVQGPATGGVDVWSK